jgi:hypothetical protein
MIINVYNPRGEDLRLVEWPRIQNALLEAQEEVLLLGDFTRKNTLHMRLARASQPLRP